jgi:cytochrome P450
MDTEEQPSAVQEWSPLDPDYLAVERHLRDKCPVAHTSQLGGFWGIARYADITAAARDAEHFCSSQGMTIPRLGTIVRQVPIEFDPPEHSAYRRILQPYFLPSYVDNLQARFRALAISMLDPILSSGRADIVVDFTHPYPARALCLWMNLPEDAWPRLKVFGEESLRTRTLGDVEANRAVETAITDYIRELFDDRRAKPRDPETDLLSGLLAARVNGDPIDDLTLVGAIRTLLTAGHNSTTSAMSNTVLYLAEHPQAQDQLRSEPTRIPLAIEEILRLYTPIRATGRTVVGGVEVAGQKLHDGDYVGLLWNSGSRDEAAFADADKCILDRSPNRHLAFGYGIHKCIGADFARLEMRVAFEELLKRTTQFTVGGGVKHVTWPIVTIASLPLEVTV